MLLNHLWTPLLTTLVLASSSQAQSIVYDAIHNATTIVGTWSSGSKNVRTGAGFANPANQSFRYPKTTGVSYSFSDDGFYEIARYRFKGNGSEPTCIIGIVGWVHGKYTLQPNGSITMVPLGDGYQQIQDQCAAQSNFVELYNLTELYVSWRIFQDPQTSDFKLHLFQFDGAPVAPQFLVSPTPDMLPKRLLRNVTAPPTTQDGLTTQNLLATGSAAAFPKKTTMGVVIGTFVVGVVTLML